MQQNRYCFKCCIKAIIAVFLICGIIGIAVGDDWQVLKGEHFLVYYLGGRDFAKEALREAERYYDKIASDLGYSRYDKFWQWEDRVKIYIYRTQEEFHRSTGAIEWATGMVNYDKKEIASYRRNERFLDSLLPHELAHLIFRDFVGFEGDIPLWIDEGVAQWEEKFKREGAIGIVKGLIKEGNFISIAELTRMDIRQNRDATLVRNFYAQAATIIGYLIERYGGSKFTLFCRQLRDGKSVDKALSFVYANSIRNVDELERKWIKYYGGGEIK